MNNLEMSALPSAVASRNIGTRLQSSPRRVRAEALQGCWSYHLRCAPFAIVAQVAPRFGLRATTIEDYVASPGAVRERIAAETGITVREAKTCILALLLGVRPCGEIPDIVGVVGVQHLFACEAFAAIAREVKLARTAIVAGWPRTRTGYLDDASGVGIHQGEVSELILAHLTRGFEEKALLAVIAIAPGPVSLLEHGGWSVRERMNVATVEVAIQNATGLDLRVDERPISVESDDPCQWASEPSPAA